MYSADASTHAPLIAALPGVLSIRWASEFILADNGGVSGSTSPCIDAGAVLMVPLCGTDLGQRSDFLDVEQLWRSAEQPGRYRIVNCACGVASDAEVDAGIAVSHPDRSTILWDIGVQGMRGMFPRPPPWGDQPGIIRLAFDRDEYERRIREFVRAMQARAVQPIRWDAIGHLHCGGDRAIEAGRAEYPQVEALPVRVWLPNFNGTQREELLAMDADAPFVRGLPVEEAEDGWPPLG